MAKIGTIKNKRPIPFEVDGETMYAKRLTVWEAKEMHKRITEMNSEIPKAKAEGEEVELTDAQQRKVEGLMEGLIMYLFEEVLVGEDGTHFEDLTDYDALSELLPITLMNGLPEAVMGALSGKQK